MIEVLLAESGSPMKLAVCTLFQIVWADSHIVLQNLDCKSVEACLRFLSADRMRKRSSWDAHFLSQTSPVILNLTFSFQMVLRLTPNNATTWIGRT